MIAANDLFDLMVDQFRNIGIHYVILNDVQRDCRDIDQHFRERIGVEDWYDRIVNQIAQNLHPGDLAVIYDELQMNYALYALPADLTEVCHCRVLSIGPVLFDPVTNYDIPAILRAHSISPAYQEHFAEFYNQAFFSANSNAWYGSLMFYLQRLNGDRPIHFRQASVGEDGYNLDTDYKIPQDPDIALTMVEERYRAERAMIEAVTAGNYEEALPRGQRFLQYRLSPRTSSPLRDKKNICFVFNTLMRKAAEAGGVHPLHLDNLSRQFAIQIEKALSVDQLTNLQYLMLRKYCLLVQNYARSTYPALVQRCMNTIDFYYNADLSLSWLARQCNVSESHLSATFKKAVGMTVTEYVNQTRIRQALTLLNSTSLSIGEIAARCGFDDANYFSRIFRKIEGKSPKEYRAMVHGSN